MTTIAPTREQVEALLALATELQEYRKSEDFDGIRHTKLLLSFAREARDVAVPLAESYLATLDAPREGEREALRGMRDWLEMMGYGDGVEGPIAEIDRRLAEGETT